MFDLFNNLPFYLNWYRLKLSYFFLFTSLSYRNYNEKQRWLITLAATSLTPHLPLPRRGKITKTWRLSNFWCNWFLEGFHIYMFVKACHSSAFQTILVRSVYIKIINYSGRTLANLKYTLQIKQQALKKQHSYCIKTETRFTRISFCGGRILSKKMFEILNLYWFKELELYSIYLYF